MTEPGFMDLTISSVISTGAISPGTRAPRMTRSASATSGLRASLSFSSHSAGSVCA